jgi:hypothetical protein
MYINNQRRYARVTNAVQLSQPIIMASDSPEIILDELSTRFKKDFEEQREVSQAELEELHAQFVLYLEDKTREAAKPIKEFAEDHGLPTSQASSVPHTIRVETSEGILTAIVSYPEVLEEVVEERIMVPGEEFARDLFEGVSGPPVNGHLNVHGRAKMPEAQPLLMRVQRMMRTAFYGSNLKK